MDIPVYLFTGFLESGKTKFIQETMEDARFNSGEKTLMLICENGIEKYNVSSFAYDNVEIINIKSEDEISERTCRAWEKKYRPEKVVIEYNGMWLVDNLYRHLPRNWPVYQEMCFMNAPMFIPYNNNMRQLMFDKLKGAELVVLNRATDKIDTQEVHKIVRGASKRAQIAYEFTDGRVAYDEIEDPLPYDLDAETVVIKDEDYAVFYRDINDDVNKYVGKTVKFKGICAKEPDMAKNEFVAGRHVMTCCVEDIQYMPFVCRTSGKPGVKTRDWRMITGKIELEYSDMYEGRGPVIHITDLSATTPPQEQVAVFY